MAQLTACTIIGGEVIVKTTQGTTTSGDGNPGGIAINLDSFKAEAINNTVTIGADATFDSRQRCFLPSSPPVSFDDVDSLRLRLGVRAAYELSAMLSVYGGLAWEYEFWGEADGSTNGYSIVAPSLKCGTGMGEVGFSIKPFKEGKLTRITLGLGGQGFVGQREGVSGNGQISYKF